jgi:hypothetical protein
MRKSCGEGALGSVLNEARVEGQTLKNLTVLSPQVDPFRIDTPANHRLARWFTEQIERFIGEGRVHLRGLHYKMVGNVYLPESQSMRYTNTIKCWVLVMTASKAARWLNYVPYDRIVDNRNDPPVIYVPTYAKPDVQLDQGESGQHELPDEDDVLPHFICDVEAQQPYRIVFFGEKSSLADVLEPIAQRIGAEMVLCTGESSNTRIEEIARRGNEDGRPLVILYFCDFDPSGWQMSISVSRKLQACRHLLYPDLAVQVHHVGLTLEQIKRFDLPETPLKPEEKRGDKWTMFWGHAQTEIDSMLALHPEALREIALEAVKPFYDETLSKRSYEAWSKWSDAADEAIEGHPSFDEHRNAILDARANVAEAIEALVEAQENAYRDLLDVEPPVPVEPEPEIDIEPPDPIFTSEDDYVTATEKLIKRKNLIGDLGGNE